MRWFVTAQRVPLVALVVLLGCNDDAVAPGTDETTGEALTGSTSLVPSTTGLTEPTLTGEMDTDTDDSDDTAPGGQCSIYEQDCALGEKCVPWSDQPDLVPDDIRCCPIDGSTPKEIGDSCTVSGYFGSCLDDCEVGSFCLDVFDSGQGTCQKLCTGSASNPTCDDDESCLIYFTGVPMCFKQCDPLLQACGAGQGCYPDEEAEGGTGFICLPTIAGDGTYGDLCWLLSGCAPGFMCVYPDFLPDCNASVGCCTAICDTAEPDSCDQFHPENVCVSWYYAGQEPPSAALLDVGVCATPQN